MIALRAFYAALALAFLAMIVWAFGTASFWSSFAAITGDPWGLVTLADLYVGFFVATALIVMVEGPKPWVIALAISIFVLGNVVTALWFAWRLPEMARRLGQSR